jgi:hypothetical protein
MNLKQKADDLRWAFSLACSVADPDPERVFAQISGPEYIFLRVCNKFFILNIFKFFINWLKN